MIREIDKKIEGFNQKEKTKKEKELKKDFKVGLITLPPWSVEEPPLGLAYLSEYLKSKNIDVKVFDLNIEIYNKFKDEYNYLWKLNNQGCWFDEKKFKNLFKFRRLRKSKGKLSA